MVNIINHSVKCKSHYTSVSVYLDIYIDFNNALDSNNISSVQLHTKQQQNAP